MLLIAFHRHHALAAGLAAFGLAAAARFAFLPASSPAPAMPLVSLDGYARLYIGWIALAGIVVVVLAYGYLERHRDHREEFYLLLLVATLGAMVLACSTHFVSFFLGLETLTVSLYPMIAYPYFRQRPLEAGIKYVVLAAASSAILLFGMALIYAETGTMDFARLAALAADAPLGSSLVLPATALIVAGIGFKLAAVPFHMWAADVYEGAPVPATAFLATVSKGGVVALLLRYFHDPGLQPADPVFAVFSLIAIASMLAGNLLALLQNNVKRVLAYSSIAHMGYILVAFLAGGTVGPEAATFYLVAYFITTLGAFGVMSVLSRPDREAVEFSDYRSLFWRRPLLAGIFAAMLLSLAGIPLTAGFMGKFFIFAAGTSAALWSLLATLVLGSTIGLFYYLRIIVALFEPLGEEAAPAAHTFTPKTGMVALSILAVLLLWLGLSPAPLLETVAAAVAGLG